MKKHYILFTVTVAYLANGITRHQGFNVLETNETGHVTREMLGQVQKRAQIRFLTEIDGKAQINDVLINNISQMGEMTPEEFHKGFDLPDEKPTQTSPETPAAAAVNQADNDTLAGAGAATDTGVGRADDSELPAALRGGANND